MEKLKGGRKEEKKRSERKGKLSASDDTFRERYITVILFKTVLY